MAYTTSEKDETTAVTGEKPATRLSGPAAVQSSRSGWGYAVSVLMIVGFYLALSLVLGHQKVPGADEALFADPALNLITTGSMGTRVLETAGTPWQGMARHTYWNPPLHMLAQAGWYQLFGFSLWSLRALSTAWGLLAIVSWWFIMKALFGDRNLALFAAALVASDAAFLHFSSQGRMDMMSASLGLAGIAAYLNLRQRSLSWALFAGNALVVAAGLTHPIGGVLWLSAFIVTVVYMDRTRLHVRHIIPALAPYLIGAAGWGSYILQSPMDFIAQFGGNLLVRDRLTGVTPWSALRLEAARIVFDFFGITPESSRLAAFKLIVPALYLAAMIGGFFQRDLRNAKGFRLLVLIAILSYVVVALTDHGQRPHYLVHILVCLPPILAVCLYYASIHGRVPVWLAILITFGFVGVQVSRTFHVIYRNTYAGAYTSVGKFVTNAKRPDDLVMGSAELAFYLGFTPRFIDDPSLGFYSGKRPDWIVMSERYAVYFDYYRRRQPELLSNLTKLLDRDYQQVYRAGEYQVLARRNVLFRTTGFVSKRTDSAH